MTLALYRYQLPLPSPDLSRQGGGGARGCWSALTTAGGNRPPAGLLPREPGRAQAEAIACLERLAAGRRSPRSSLQCIRAGLRPPLLACPDHCAAGALSAYSGSPQELLKHWKNWLHKTPSKAKLKVARYPMRDELALIRLLCTASLPSSCAGRQPGLDPRGGLGLLRPSGSNRIEYLEDPCADFADIAFVANRTGHAGGHRRAAGPGQAVGAHPQLRALVLKPTLLGSLAHCEALVARARELRLKVIVSSCFESGLGLNQLFHLAGEWAPDQAPGLDTKRWLAADLLDATGNPT